MNNCGVGSCGKFLLTSTS